MQLYHLIHRFAWADALEYSNQSFSTENEAMARACALIGAGDLGNFLIKDGANRIVADDNEIKARWQTMST